MFVYNSEIIIVDGRQIIQVLMVVFQVIGFYFGLP